MNQEKITLTRNELKYIAESLAVQKIHEIMKSKSRLNEVLLKWDNAAPEEDEGILSTDEISDKLKGTFWNGSSSEPIDDEIIDWSNSESSEDDEDEWGSEPLEDEEDEIIDWSSSEPIDDEDEWGSE